MSYLPEVSMTTNTDIVPTRLMYFLVFYLTLNSFEQAFEISQSLPCTPLSALVQKIPQYVSKSFHIAFELRVS